MMTSRVFDEIVDALRVQFARLPNTFAAIDVCGPVAGAVGVDVEDVADVIDVLLLDGSLRHSVADEGLLFANPVWLGDD